MVSITHVWNGNTLPNRFGDRSDLGSIRRVSSAPRTALVDGGFLDRFRDLVPHEFGGFLFGPELRRLPVEQGEKTVPRGFVSVIGEGLPDHFLRHEFEVGRVPAGADPLADQGIVVVVVLAVVDDHRPAFPHAAPDRQLEFVPPVEFGPEDVLGILPGDRIVEEIPEGPAPVVIMHVIGAIGGQENLRVPERRGPKNRRHRVPPGVTVLPVGFPAAGDHQIPLFVLATEAGLTERRHRGATGPKGFGEKPSLRVRDETQQRDEVFDFLRERHFLFFEQPTL